MKSNSRNSSHYQKGFSLIEILIVIAIIGILASVVVASLNAAKVKAANVVIKSGLNNTRAQAELFYGATNSYAAICTAANGIKDILLAAAQKAVSPTTTVTNDAATTNTTPVCNDATNGKSWATEMPLQGGGYYCVDNTNINVESPTPLLTSTTDTICA